MGTDSNYAYKESTLNNPHSLTLHFLNTNKNQIILAIGMEIFNEIQQNRRYWGNLRQISVINIAFLQSDYIKGLVSCMYAFLSFTIMKFINIFSNVSQLHIEKHSFPDICLLIFLAKCFTKLGKNIMQSINKSYTMP